MSNTRPGLPPDHRAQRAVLVQLRCQARWCPSPSGPLTSQREPVAIQVAVLHQVAGLGTLGILVGIPPRVEQRQHASLPAPPARGWDAQKFGLRRERTPASLLENMPALWTRYSLDAAAVHRFVKGLILIPVKLTTCSGPPVISVARHTLDVAQPSGQVPGWHPPQYSGANALISLSIHSCTTQTCLRRGRALLSIRTT